jgi:DNA-binding NarL/FixJ family response regulator
MNSQVRIFVADDQPDLALLLCEGLAPYEQFDVVGSAPTTENALEQVRHLEVDVLLLDIRMPQMNGLEAMGRFRAAKPSMHIVVITSLRPEDAELQAMKAGADGYVWKEGVFSRFLGELIQEVELVTRGKLFFDLQAWNSVRPLLQELPAVIRPRPRLSARELEVLLLIVEGLTSKQIAARIGRSKKTVDKHRQRITKRLQIRGTANLTKFAFEAGLCPPRGR